MTPFSRRSVVGSASAFLAGIAVLNRNLVASEPKPAPVTPTGAATPPGKITRLNYNENPFGPSAPARQALLTLGDGTWKYSYEEVAALRALLASHEGVQPQNIFVGEGSGEILKVAAMIYGEAGHQLIASHPTYPMLPQYAARRGATITWVNLNGSFNHDFAALKAHVKDETTLIYICNPNNPTGVLADPTELRAFIQAIPQHVLVLVDEAYLDFAAQPERASMIDQVKSGKNILVTRSFSKIYGLAGLRIGYGIGSESVIRHLEALRISIPNQAGIAAARASVGDVAFCSDTRAKIEKSKSDAVQLFGELGLRYLPSQSNFMMFDTGAENFEFLGFARQRGLLVAEVVEPFSKWVRVSMGRPEDMREFANVLRAFVRKS
jgi:histidinol-phosphate aminotransferase